MANVMNKDPFTNAKDRQDFVEDLKSFHAVRGTPFDRVPKLEGTEVDLCRLYRRVIDLGGWKKVTQLMLWEDLMEEFNIPTACTNGPQALKYVYIRFLKAYEKVKVWGEDPEEDGGDSRDGHSRKKVLLPLEQIPQTYNYIQHNVTAAEREAHKLSTELVQHSDYMKLEQALCSGLANEADFALNVCLVLSGQTSRGLLLTRAPRLLPLLMAHVGLFEDGPGSMENVMLHSWSSGDSLRDFSQFWLDVVKDEEMRDSLETNSVITTGGHVGSEVFHKDRDLRLKDVEGQRVTQLAVLVRNLSLEAVNQRLLASSPLVFRFLMLCVHTSCGSLCQLALDTLCNLSTQLVLETEKRTAHQVMTLIHRSLQDDDRMVVLRGLEVLSGLCEVDQNEEVLGMWLVQDVYSRLVQLLLVQDVQLLTQALEALLQLSGLGSATATRIASVHSAVDVLVNLVTVDVQSLGSDAQRGVRVVEGCPQDVAIEMGGQWSSQQQPMYFLEAVSLDRMPESQVQPVEQPLPVNKTPSEVEKTASNWLTSTYEAKEGSSVKQSELYTDYQQMAAKFRMTKFLSLPDLIATLRRAVPQVCVAEVDRGGGGKEGMVQGLCRRQQAKPFAILTATVNPNPEPAPAVSGMATQTDSPQPLILPKAHSIDVTSSVSVGCQVASPAAVAQTWNQGPEKVGGQISKIVSASEQTSKSVSTSSFQQTSKMVSCSQQTSKVESVSSQQMSQTASASSQQMSQTVSASSKQLSQTVSASTQQSQTVSVSSQQMSQMVSASSQQMSQTLSASSQQMSQTASASSQQMSQTVSASSQQMSQTASASSQQMSQTVSASSQQMSQTASASSQQMSQTVSASSQQMSQTVSVSSQKALKAKLLNHQHTSSSAKSALSAKPSVSSAKSSKVQQAGAGKTPIRHQTTNNRRNLPLTAQQSSTAHPTSGTYPLAKASTFAASTRGHTATWITIPCRHPFTHRSHISGNAGDQMSSGWVGSSGEQLADNSLVKTLLANKVCQQMGAAPQGSTVHPIAGVGPVPIVSISPLSQGQHVQQMQQLAVQGQSTTVQFPLQSQPVTLTQQPVTITQQPVTLTQQPVTLTQQPVSVRGDNPIHLEQTSLQQIVAFPTQHTSLPQSLAHIQLQNILQQQAVAAQHSSVQQTSQQQQVVSAQHSEAVAAQHNSLQQAATLHQIPVSIQTTSQTPLQQSALTVLNTSQIALQQPALTVQNTSQIALQQPALTVQNSSQIALQQPALTVQNTIPAAANNPTSGPHSSVLQPQCQSPILKHLIGSHNLASMSSSLYHSSQGLSTACAVTPHQLAVSSQTSQHQQTSGQVAQAVLSAHLTSSVQNFSVGAQQAGSLQVTTANTPPLAVAQQLQQQQQPQQGVSSQQTQQRVQVQQSQAQVLGVPPQVYPQVQHQVIQMNGQHYLVHQHLVPHSRQQIHIQCRVPGQQTVQLAGGHIVLQAPSQSVQLGPQPQAMVVQQSGQLVLQGQAMQSVLQQIQAPGQAVQNVLQQTHVPGQAVQSVLQQIQAPGQAVQNVLQQTQVPGQAMQSVLQQTQVPGQAVQSVLQQTQAPVQAVQSVLQQSLQGQVRVIQLPMVSWPGSAVSSTTATSTSTSCIVGQAGSASQGGVVGYRAIVPRPAPCTPSSQHRQQVEFLGPVGQTGVCGSRGQLLQQVVKKATQGNGGVEQSLCHTGSTMAGPLSVAHTLAPSTLSVVRTPVSLCPSTASVTWSLPTSSLPVTSQHNSLLTPSSLKSDTIAHARYNGHVNGARLHVTSREVLWKGVDENNADDAVDSRVNGLLSSPSSDEGEVPSPLMSLKVKKEMTNGCLQRCVPYQPDAVTGCSKEWLQNLTQQTLTIRQAFSQDIDSDKGTSPQLGGKGGQISRNDINKPSVWQRNGLVSHMGDRPAMGSMCRGLLTKDSSVDEVSLDSTDSDMVFSRSSRAAGSRLLMSPDGSYDGDRSSDSRASSVEDFPSQARVFHPIPALCSTATSPTPPPSTTSSSSGSADMGHSVKRKTPPDVKKAAVKSKKLKTMGEKKTTTAQTGRSQGEGPRTLGMAGRIQGVGSRMLIMEYVCEWAGCCRRFSSAGQVLVHVTKNHVPNVPDTPDLICQWGGCPPLQRKRWSLVTHVQDQHCTEAAQLAACQRRFLQAHRAVLPPAGQAQAMGYPEDAAQQAIQRFQRQPPFVEFTEEEKEGPLTKHIRLTSALTLRNIARYSSLGRRLIKRREQDLSYVAMSVVESSSSLASCLWELLHSC